MTHLTDQEKLVLSFLYDSKGSKPFSISKVRRGINKTIDRDEVGYLLRNLIGYRLVRTKKIPGFSSNGVRYPAEDAYEITPFGIQVYENGLEFPERVTTPNTVIIGESINFGTITLNEININQFIDSLNISQTIKDEVHKQIEELKEELKNEQLNKGKLKNILNRIRDKGIDKLTETAINIIIKQIIG